MEQGQTSRMSPQAGTLAAEVIWKTLCKKRWETRAPSSTPGIGQLYDQRIWLFFRQIFFLKRRKSLKKPFLSSCKFHLEIYISKITIEGLLSYDRRTGVNEGTDLAGS